MQFDMDDPVDQNKALEWTPRNQSNPKLLLTKE